MNAPAPARPTRFAPLNEFVDTGLARLRQLGCGAAVGLLWCVVWRFVNAETDMARVSLRKLAECIGSDTKSVRRLIHQLQRHGHLVVVDAGKRGRGGHCATYRLVAVPVAEETKGAPCPHSEPNKGGTTPPLEAPERGVEESTKGGMAHPLEPNKGGVVPPVQKKDRTEYSPGGRRGGASDRTQKAKPKPKPRRADRPKREPNPNHKPAVDYFFASFEAKYRRKYVFAGKKDGDAVTFLLSAVDNDLGAFRAMVDRYLADDRDKYVADNAHNLGTLRMRVNKYTPRGGAAVPVGTAAADLRAQERLKYLKLVADRLMTLDEAERAHGGPLNG